MGLNNSSFNENFLRHINFDSEKHMKKLRSKGTGAVLKNKDETDLKSNENLDKRQGMDKNKGMQLNKNKEMDQLNKERRQINFETLNGDSWLDDTIINEYGKILKQQFSQSVFVFDSHFLEHLGKHGYEAVKRWDKM